MAALRIRTASGWAFKKLIVWASPFTTPGVATSPTITSGGAPPTPGVGNSTEPVGSFYLNTAGTTAADTLYVTVSGSTWLVIDGS